MATLPSIQSSVDGGNFNACLSWVMMRPKKRPDLDSETQTKQEDKCRDCALGSLTRSCDSPCRGSAEDCHQNSCGHPGWLSFTLQVARGGQTAQSLFQCRLVILKSSELKTPGSVRESPPTVLHTDPAVTGACPPAGQVGESHTVMGLVSCLHFLSSGFLKIYPGPKKGMKEYTYNPAIDRLIFLYLFNPFLPILGGN